MEDHRRGEPLPLVPHDRRREDQGAYTRQLVVLSCVVALALGTIPSLASGILFARAAREDLLERQIDACHRNNEIRATLQQIILEGKATLSDYYKSGTITRAQFQRALATADRNAKLVAPVKSCGETVRG